MVSASGGGRQFGAFVVGGHRSYVLSGSYILSKEIMDRFSGCEAAIEITSVPDFAHAIARQLAGFASGFSGYCIYAGNRVLVRHLEGDPFPLPEDPAEGIPVEKVLAAATAAGRSEEMLLKHKRYAYQAEYRLVWNMDAPPQDSIIVTAPDARQFCRKVDAAELR